MQNKPLVNAEVGKAHGYQRVQPFSLFCQAHVDTSEALAAKALADKALLNKFAAAKDKKGSLRAVHMKTELGRIIEAMPKAKIKSLTDRVMSHFNQKTRKKAYRPERVLISTLMQCCINYELLHDSINLFDAYRHAKAPDIFTLGRAVRAASSTRPWAYTLQLLDEAHSLHAKDPKMITVVYNALSSLKHQFQQNDALFFPMTLDVVKWMDAKGIAVDDQSMGTVLAVACKHGNLTSIEEVLGMMKERSIKPSLVTLNTILNQAAEAGDANWCDALMQQIHSVGLKPSDVSYNTMLKLCVRRGDTARAVKVLEEMRAAGFAANDEFTSSLIYQLPQDDITNSSIVQHQIPSNMTSFVCSNAIRACSEPDKAMELFAAAIASNHANEVVYVTMAQFWTNRQEYVKAFDVIHRMLFQNMGIHPFTVSFVIQTCFDFHRISGRPQDGLQQLVSFLKFTHQHQQALLDYAVKNKVMKELLELQEEGLACALSNLFFSDTHFSSGLTSKLFQRLRDLAQRAVYPKVVLLPVGDGWEVSEVDRETAMEFTSKHALSALRAVMQPRNIIDKLAVEYCNAVLRLHAMNNDSNGVDEVIGLMQHSAPPLAPNGVTIAQVARYHSRLSNTSMLAEVIKCVEQNVQISFATANELLTVLNREGDVDTMTSLYDYMYHKGIVQHWAVRNGTDLQIDLHHFHKGMAKAAVAMAMREIASDPLLAAAATLTIITGQNIRSERPSSPFALLNEVQEVLIESFYPPISSSTVPGNPGAIAIDLQDIRSAPSA